MATLSTPKNEMNWQAIHDYIGSSFALQMPVPWVFRGWLLLSWGVVVAWIGLAALGNVSINRQRAWVLLCAFFMLLPGSWSPVFWLGMMFQSPSLLAVGLCAASLLRRFAPYFNAPPRVGTAEVSEPTPRRTSHGVAVTRWQFGSIVFGWALGLLLLMDVFALLPVHVYAWGFSSIALIFAAVIAIMLWLTIAKTDTFLSDFAVILLASLLLFALLRLPDGNIWDALLDPGLWIVLNFWLARLAWSRLRSMASGSGNGSTGGNL